MKSIIEDTTILVQGPLSIVSIDNIDNYKKYCKQIIFHTWKDDFQVLDRFIPADDNIKVVIEDVPERSYKHEMFYRYATLWYQVNGIFKGATNCDTKYLIRTRSDERYTTLLPLIEKFSQDVDGVVSSNIVWRHDIWKYHMGDHLFMGKTQLIKQVYEKFVQFSKHGFTFFDAITSAATNPNHLRSCEQLLYFLFFSEGAQPIPIDTKDLGNFLVSVQGKPYTSKNISTLKKLVPDFVLDTSEIKIKNKNFQELVKSFVSDGELTDTRKSGV
tara:strand:- start:49 stop:864 length:816 start_codon:yes stop_codon:yes gene_type:complete